MLDATILLLFIVAKDSAKPVVDLFGGIMKTNLLLCPGEVCPLRMTCTRFHAWLDNEDEDEMEMVPAYKDGHCELYNQKEFYGQ